MRRVAGGGVVFTGGNVWDRGDGVDLAALACRVPILAPKPRKKQVYLHAQVERPKEAEEAGAAGDGPVVPDKTAEAITSHVTDSLMALMTPEEAAAAAADVSRAGGSAAAAAQAAKAAALEAAAEAYDEEEGGASPRPASEANKEVASSAAQAAAALQELSEATPSVQAATTAAAEEKGESDIPKQGGGDVQKAASDFLATESPGQGQEEITRQHIFIMSPPGVGKTTMVQRLLAALREEEGEGAEVTGFFTEEVRDAKQQRAGFDLVRVGAVAPQEKRRSVLARLGKEPPTVGKYAVDLKSFESFALPLLKPPAKFQVPNNPRVYTNPDGSEVLVSLLKTGIKPPKKKVEKPDFDPCKEFQGARKGRVFKLGSQGLGYYKDRFMQQPESDSDSESSSSSATGDEGDMLCHVFVPETQTEATVQAKLLQALPEGWKAPEQEDEEERLKYPRLVVCDEVGKMGLLSKHFGPTLEEAMGSNECIVLGTIPQANKGQRDVEVIDNIKRKKNVYIVRVTRNNRDTVPIQVYAKLRESLGLGPPGTGKPRPRRLSKREREAQMKLQAEEAKKKAVEDKKKAKLVKEKRKNEQKKKERREKAEKHQKLKEAVAQKARELRKQREEIRRKAKEAAEAGTLEVEEEDDVEALGPSPEVAIDDEDLSADDAVAEVADLASDNEAPQASPKASPSVVDSDEELVMDVSSAKPPPTKLKPAKAPPALRPVPAKVPVPVNGKKKVPAIAKTVVGLDDDEIL
eukprot:TRINITY_DN15703_c0_g1_i1.p1 TRINITY_DN15703_c0_g1~~TRINITY_DN15703_c0_g1_i1.p1  ORF type:complete len:749 (+),score=207.28 TRINITY_DN15703_c0_g1_i1:137-2383(+)